MERILIGSSNINRFYKPEAFKDHKPYIMVKSTKFEHFKVKMDSLEKGKKQVVVSVIENFLCDAVGSDPQDEDRLNEIIESVIREFTGVIERAGKRDVESKFVIVKPIKRPRDKWYEENFDEMSKYYTESVNKLKLENVTVADAISSMSQNFEPDMVHLTMEAGLTFIDGILRAAEDFFNAELVDLEDEREVAMDIADGGCSGSSKTIGTVDQKTIEKTVQQMTDRFNQRKESDNLIFARIREELDFISNVKKEDRIIITGLTSKDPIPVVFDEKKKWMAAIVKSLLDIIDPDLNKEILFINQGKSNGRDIPMAEVRFSSTECAKKASSCL